MLNQIAVNETYINQEMNHLKQIERFSMIENQVLLKVKEEFISYHPVNFIIDLPEGCIEVIFSDETAEIVYDFDQIIYASVDFDMVFESILDYSIMEPLDKIDN